MLVTQHTSDRILDMIKRGVKLVYHYYYVGYDSYSFLTQVTLEHDGVVLILSHREDCPGGTRPFSEDGPNDRLVYDAAETVIKHPDIRRGYPGYQGDQGDHWREVYEHKDTPQPWWVKAQVTWDENGQIQ